MSDDCHPPPKRVKLARDDLQRLSKEELVERLLEKDAYIDSVASKHGILDGESTDELTTLRESKEKLKAQQMEASQRENVLVMRLTTKEQQMHDYATQISELKAAQNPSTAQLRSMLLDPAINLMFLRMKKEMDSCKEKLEQAQNDLAAWKFTPDSQTGKRLMARCRMLLQENEELGKVISSGRTAKLEGEIALEKTLVQEMKKSQADMDEFLVELDEDVEGMQSTIYLLQNQLKTAKEQLAQLQQDNEQLRNNQCNHKHCHATDKDSLLFGDVADGMLPSKTGEKMPEKRTEPATSGNSGTSSSSALGVSNYSELHGHHKSGGSHVRSNGTSHHRHAQEPSDGLDSGEEGNGGSPVRTTREGTSSVSRHLLRSGGEGRGLKHSPPPTATHYQPSENTDATSSEGWSSPAQDSKPVVDSLPHGSDVEDNDDVSSVNSQPEPERTEIGRKLRGSTKKCSREADLPHNGMVDTPPYDDSQGEDTT